MEAISATSMPKTPEEIYEQDTLKEIRSILKQVNNIKRNIQHFRGKTKDQEYLFIDDTLLKCTLKLDNINSKGNSFIRDERKSAINYIQQLIAELDAKLDDWTSEEDAKKQ